VATRSLFPSGSSMSHSRRARPSSSTGIPNSCDTSSMLFVMGPRTTDTNHGNPGSNWCPRRAEPEAFAPRDGASRVLDVKDWDDLFVYHRDNPARASSVHRS